jgi:hypothetical protein
MEKEGMDGRWMMGGSTWMGCWLLADVWMNKPKKKRDYRLMQQKILSFFDVPVSSAGKSSEQENFDRCT